MDDPIRGAVAQLKRLPGIGEKTATRLVYWLLRAPGSVTRDLADALHTLADGVCECSVCCNLTAQDPCRICRAQRVDDVLLVVEEPQDVLAFERSGEFGGRYHVLHGALSPMDGVAPGQLRIRQLLERLRSTDIREVVLATNATVEGDATALYLARLLAPMGLSVTRLAHGLSVGTEIEYANAVSLARALQNRREV
ncbi:MAG: recombination protein RecR [Myxococcota bacterium]|jgi:recombination protein RecR